MNSPLIHSGVDACDPHLQWVEARQVQWPDRQTRNWLCEQGSLTRLLKLASDDHFRVQVLDEHEQSIDNTLLLSEFGPLAAEHSFWSRKVALCGHDQPWVLAHTLLPAHSELSELQRVRSLGSKPLGEFLFDHAELKRSHLHVTSLPSGIWGRKSLFFLFRKPIMVAEFFLPEILALPVPD